MVKEGQVVRMRIEGAYVCVCVGGVDLGYIIEVASRVRVRVKVMVRARMRIRMVVRASMEGKGEG